LVKIIWLLMIKKWKRLKIKMEAQRKLLWVHKPKWIEWIVKILVCIKELTIIHKWFLVRHNLRWQILTIMAMNLTLVVMNRVLWLVKVLDAQTQQMKLQEVK
jgi:hypothetical protein